ncbi:hypothetical protein AGDE_14073 [Angomonas deanei]|uniref:Uncharacterized protein n=1 Tax=Angomonas deanei TaxID=59799 RepID=A0A7G2CNZ5_9TRYP|nr:hypothetical protein AGDE_14073 [Angomonas deanei]CAD2220827.1 hypothetical protein, conserved [Angomonas deanei]|eukprot:EPY21462.1 hypothetical protein AGDE_14073 [Angomonas deanei]
MTSALLAEWMNTHLVFAVAQNTVPAPFVHYMDIHEKILERFFDDVGQTNISAAELIEQSASVDSIYEALTIKYELKKTEKYTQVRHFLELFIPSFVSACPVICYICHEREAEFLEEMHLSLKCSSITPSTWLRIKRPDGSCAYFSTVSGFSQEHCPLVLKDLDCTTLEFPEKVECKRLSLCNAAQEQSKADTMFALRSELFGYSLCGSHHTDSVRNHMQSLITGFESFLAFSLFEDV